MNDEQNPKDESYVILAHLGDASTWLTKEMAANVESAMSENGWKVEIREPRGNSEAEGTYYRTRHGDLQILGYSIPEPRDFKLALHDAVEASYSAIS